MFVDNAVIPAAGVPQMGALIAVMNHIMKVASAMETSMPVAVCMSCIANRLRLISLPSLCPKTSVGSSPLYLRRAAKSATPMKIISAIVIIPGPPYAASDCVNIMIIHSVTNPTSQLGVLTSRHMRLSAEAS